jgi:hypothetical protein
VLHWDGARWAVTRSPDPLRGSFNVLNGVSALSPSDVWAVGYYSNRSGQKDLILRWNGTRWAQVTSPGPLGSALASVSAVSASDAWAAGTYGRCARSC